MVKNALLTQHLQPSHIGIIMDGNGRWAQQRNRPRTFGHQAGMQTAKDIIKVCAKRDVNVLTLYAFSTENWNRPRLEVACLMELFKDCVSPENIEKFNANNIRVNLYGESDALPFAVKHALHMAVHMTQRNTGMSLNLGINYGGRAEIVSAARSVARSIQSGDLDPATLNESVVDQHLCSAGMPDLDLIIRTGGEMRLSNFLIWQAVDSYFWVTDTYGTGNRRSQPGPDS